MNNLIIEKLASRHNRKGFTCGSISLDNYLHHQVSQDIKKKLAACFVLSDRENNVKGFYTLSSSGIPRDQVPESIQKKMPRAYSQLPTILLGRLALDLSCKGKGLGKLLLIDALKRSHNLSKEIGSIAVIVDPIDEGATHFYKQFQFTLLPTSGKMFLSMKVIQKLFV